MDNNLPSLHLHFHVLWIDGWIDDDPGTASQFRVGRNVNQHWLLVFPQSVHDVSTEFQHLKEDEAEEVEEDKDEEEDEEDKEEEDEEEGDEEEGDEEVEENPS